MIKQDVDLKDRDGDLLQIVNDGSLNINIQDQATRPYFRKLEQVLATYTLTSDTVIDSYTISVTDATGLTAGNEISLEQDSDNPYFFKAKVKSVNGNDVTINTPIPFVFDKTKAVFSKVNTNINVNGSVTPQIFNIKNIANAGFDITRLIFHIVDDTAMDDQKFGGITSLTNGVVIRRKHNAGYYDNFFTVYNNGGFGEIAGSKTYDDKAPRGYYGLSCMLTFAGQANIGVVVRLAKDEELQLIVQDDLTGLYNMVVVAEGHYRTIE